MSAANDGGAAHPVAQGADRRAIARRRTTPKIKAAGEALTAKLTDVEGEIYQYRNRSSQDPLNFPIRLNNKLAALQGIVESGDYRPTDQSHAVFKELSGQLDTQLARLDALINDGPAGVQQADREEEARARGCEVTWPRSIRAATASRGCACCACCSAAIATIRRT